MRYIQRLGEALMNWTGGHFRVLGKLNGILALAMIQTTLLQAEDSPVARPWWFGMNLGYGQLRLTSDQDRGASQGTFALAIHGGGKVGKRFRIGVELGGWTLEASNLQDPSVGVAVSNLLMLLDVLPVYDVPVYVRVGAGWARHWTNRTLDFGSDGWAWKAGAGYDIELGNSFNLTPACSFSSGYLSDIRNPIIVETGRRYSVWDISLGVSWHFGKPRIE
jgi:hypothetical protein